MSGSSQTGSTPSRRPDASMELLNSILRESVDPEYDHAAEEPVPPKKAPLLLFVICALAGLMFASSALTSGHARSGAAEERQELLTRAIAADRENRELKGQADQLRKEISQLREEAGVNQPAGLDELQVTSGAVPVTGQGIVIEIGDAGANGKATAILDQDLRQVVNGLWASGAEAIAINGNRITSQTAIRQAGSAITVNYRSLTTPYRVEVIGDSQQLPARFANTSGGRILAALKQNSAISYAVTTSASITLPADESLRVDVSGNSEPR